MDKNQRKKWNENHKIFRECTLIPERHKEAVHVLQTLHSFLHVSIDSLNSKLTLADDLLENLEGETFRQYPVSTPDTKNSIAWHLWHMTRIEDMTMNILIDDNKQVLHMSNWLEQMNIPFTHSGNDMSVEEITLLSSTINLNALLEYRKSVGKQTQEIISRLIPGQFRMKIDQKKINRLFDEHALQKKSQWLAEYWSKKDIGGLFLMPATRHNFIHLNKCIRIKNKLKQKV
ncbi:DinB family protein [Ornithinibacillus halotolerans]|uniref:DinB family protein n=1 Tax=Ornithinibacillus halotolerans TaxID=1274357 RepID=A0A916S1T8_9BACI|nr:DinB family protein [Ornithinibacillus halotolerans]GGA80045.1 hypothetical protein GCM10008025_24310 [Ornithinibacillus halotolerans]